MTQVELLKNFKRFFGKVYWVPEEFLDIWTGLAGSDPAFIAEIIDAVALGAVGSGMPKGTQL